MACTSTPANSVSSGVATTSRVPSAVVPTNTILPRSAPAGTWPLRTSAAETVRERPLLPSIAQQQIALAVDRHDPVVDRQHGGIHVGDPKRDVACACRRRDGREREAGIDAAVELGQQRHAPEDAVGVGSGVQKTRRAGRFGQHRQVAHRTGRVKEALVVSRLIGRLHDRDADRMQHARVARSRAGVERAARSRG